MKASSLLQLALFGWILARSMVFTSSTCTFWRSIQTKCMVWWQVPEFWSFVFCLNIPCKNTSNTYLSFGAVQFCELECQGRDLERKRCDQKEMWWERNATRKVCQVIETQEKELSRERVVKRKSCQDQEMPGESGVKGQRCHEKGMSWERTVVRKGWTVTGEGDFTRRRSIWRPRKNVTQQRCQENTFSMHRWSGAYPIATFLLLPYGWNMLKLPPPSCPGTLVNTTSQWMKYDGTTKTPSCKKELWWISIISTLCTRLARWPLDPQEIWGWHVLRRHAKQSGQTIAKQIRSKSSKSNHQIRLVRLVSRRWSSWACARTLCDLVCLMFHELIELRGFAIKSGKEGPTRRQGIEAGFHRKFRSFCLTLCLYESICFLALQNDLHMALSCWDGDSFDLHQKLKNGRSRALEHEIQWDAWFACSQGSGLPGLYESPIRTLIVAASGGKVLNCFLGLLRNTTTGQGRIAKYCQYRNLLGPSSDQTPRIWNLEDQHPDSDGKQIWQGLFWATWYLLKWFVRSIARLLLDC